MKALKAKRAVLYQGRMYEPGDVLPADDSRMVEAWLKAESAVWTGEDPEQAQSSQEAAENNADDQENPEGHHVNQEGQEAAEGAKGAEEGTLDVVNGHMTRESLDTMTKASLEKLAKDMGVEIPRGATKALIIDRLAAVTVEASAPDRGAQ